MISQHKRILLVEDDPLLGMILSDLLEDADYEVDGPYQTLADGMAALAGHFPDAAVLDLRLHAQDAGLLAQDLDQYDIPFLICSGASRSAQSWIGLDRSPFVRKDQLNTLIPTLNAIVH